MKAQFIYEVQSDHLLPRFCVDLAEEGITLKLVLPYEPSPGHKEFLIADKQQYNLTNVDLHVFGTHSNLVNIERSSKLMDTLGTLEGKDAILILDINCVHKDAITPDAYNEFFDEGTSYADSDNELRFIITEHENFFLVIIDSF